MSLLFLRLSVLTATLLVITNGQEIGIESGFRTIYSSYKQCESDPEMLMCLKLKALKLVDRALSINNIPILEGISLTKREDGQRSLDETVITPIDENTLPEDSQERNQKVDTLLWNRIKQFVETRSLQLRVNKLLFNENTQLDNVQDGRGKKDKNKGMYMYLMMMKGGMMALAYKGLALLAGKALLVSKIALTLALLVAIKKLFSGGHHSQKTTYEIVKTPIITHSHQYAGGNGQTGHYGSDFSGYEGGPYARSLDEPDDISKRISLKPVEAQNPRYATHVVETVEGRASRGQARSLADFHTPQNSNFANNPSTTTENLQKLNLPYAHLAAYRNQLKSAHHQDASATLRTVAPSTTTAISN